MATVYQKKNCSKWYARIKIWNDVENTYKWVSKATGTDDKNQAKVIAEEFERVSQMAKAMRSSEISVDRLTSIVESILDSAGVTVDHGAEWPKLCGYVDDYLEKHKPKVSPQTYKTYKMLLKHFKEWTADHGEGMRLDWFTPARANDYYSEMLECMVAKSANERIRMIGRIYKYACRVNGYPSNPVLSVDQLKESKDEKLERTFFNADELAKILDYLAKGPEVNQEWRRAVMLSVMAGCRLADALCMSTKNIHDGVLEYTQQKTGKRMLIPLIIDDWVDELSKCDGMICPSLGGRLKKVGNASISSEFTSLVSAAGIEQLYMEFRSKRKIARKTFHSLRHSLRTFIVSSGGTDAQADLILGHSEGEGKRYTHADIDAMKLTLSKALGS